MNRPDHSQVRLLMRENLRLAKDVRDQLSAVALRQLRALTNSYRFSIALGDLHYLESGWYVAHAGLLRLAARRHCAGIHVEQVGDACDPAAGRWVFRATVYKAPSSIGFVGFGDADPNNVSLLVRGAEMRVAETRAVNRALRKAYGIGICSVEELVSLPPNTRSAGQPMPVANPHHPTNGSNNGQPRLRDQLCQLIRQYKLNPTLVKAYAADFCGTQNLSEASRDRVEAFIRQLAKSAKENRDALQCRLNAYARPQEVTP